MTFCQLTYCFHTFSGFAHNIFYFRPPPPSEFAHRPLRKRFVCLIRPASAGGPGPYRAARARAIAVIRRQIISCDLPFCREGHGNPLAPSANTRRKPASIHYQSNNHAIPNAPSRACPISRKKIVKRLLNLGMSGSLKGKICLNADFPAGSSLNRYPPTRS